MTIKTSIHVAWITGCIYVAAMVHFAKGAENPCEKVWQWQWKTPPKLEIEAPQDVPDGCVGQITVGPAVVTATAGVKWEVDINNCPEPPHTRNETTVPITPVNTWELYSWPADTTPKSGSGTTAEFTTIHGGEVRVQFKSEASVANPPWRFRLNLIRVVGGINGDEVTEVLFSTAVTDPDRNVSRTALNSIDNRVIRRQPTSEEWGMIKERVSNASSSEARLWAYVLAHSGLVEDPELVREIATRFLADVKTPPILATNRAYSGYIQGLPLALNSYLRAFFFMDSALVIPVLREALEAATDKNAVMWLTVALGMAGDETVTDKLRTIVEDKTEVASTRAEALRAYARAARQNAIPLLEFMLQDKTPGPDPVRPPIAAVAGQELYWLRNPDRRKEIWGK